MQKMTNHTNDMRKNEIDLMFFLRSVETVLKNSRRTKNKSQQIIQSKRKAQEPPYHEIKSNPKSMQENKQPRSTTQEGS
ncbi:hypothetical protein [Pseudomonas gingeri]|uniref:hypothetical protein n=1 Tax=Pseudomonas gingeri TaxID=117681 RepID=UPI0015BDB34D|nr:hypothetical protein [Pseudomonas gingeri]NWD49600.1 hypothetical protein [Pseudomonas gingeri]